MAEWQGAADVGGIVCSSSVAAPALHKLAVYVPAECYAVLHLPAEQNGRRHGGLLSVNGRRVLIFNRGRLYLEPAASPPPWWTAQCRCRPAPLWRKAVGGSRTSLSLPDRISLQMSFKTRCAVPPDAGTACERLLKISNLRVFPQRDSNASSRCRLAPQLLR